MLYYVTGNPGKFASAKRRLSSFNISVQQKQINEIIEPQSEDIEQISISKAKQAFNYVKKPLFVTDAGWHTPALKGFPGPYMAYINKWFEPSDFLRLMNEKQDKRILLKEVLTYIDDNNLKTFSHSKEGIFLPEPSGTGNPSDTVISISKNGISIAVAKNNDVNSSDTSGMFEDFAEWYGLRAI